MNSKVANFKYYILVFSIYIFIFQNVLQEYITIFNYIDEFYAILFIPIVILRLRKNLKVKKEDFKIFIFLLIIVMIGIYSNLIYRYQTTRYVALDILAVLKFFMVFYGSYIFFNDKYFINKLEKIGFHIKLIIFSLLVLTILDYKFHFFSATVKYGLRAETLFYNHPTALAAVCVILLSILFLVNEKNIKYIIMISIIMFSTLRIKAIIFVAILYLLYIYIIERKKKINKVKVIILVIIALLVGYNQFKYFFIEIDDSARASLLRSSFEIANDYFPVGTGFGTYASHVSSENYSQIYYDYNLNDVYGLTKENPKYVSDSFWPMILGQFGYIGTIIYAYIILILILKCQRNYCKEGRNYYFSYMILIIYLIISSTSESAFVNALAIPFAYIMGITLNCLEKKKGEKDEEYSNV